jgi:hypothetical protein
MSSKDHISKSSTPRKKLAKQATIEEENDFDI